MEDGGYKNVGKRAGRGGGGQETFYYSLFFASVISYHYHLILVHIKFYGWS